MLSKIFKNFKTKGMVGQSSRFWIQKMISNIDFSHDFERKWNFFCNTNIFSRTKMRLKKFLAKESNFRSNQSIFRQRLSINFKNKIPVWGIFIS